MRRPLSILHVEYEDGDAVGALAALVSQAPVFCIVAYAALLASRRDLTTASLLAGTLLNEALNAALKAALAEPRPAGAPPFAPAHGMPSNHAQFAGFAFAALSLWAARRWGAGAAWRAAAVAAGAAAAAAVCASRLYLGYHDARQVGAGAAVGAVAGAAWHALTEAVLRPAFPALAATPLARFLLVRDATHVPHILAAEYAVCAPAPRAQKARRA